MSESNLIARGRRLLKDPTVRGMMHGDVPLSNWEMSAMLAAAKANRVRRFERTGCCGDGAWCNGRCPSVIPPDGMCPVARLDQLVARFTAALEEWESEGSK
jgi:hypothetical protein